MLQKLSNVLYQLKKLLLKNQNSEQDHRSFKDGIFNVLKKTPSVKTPQCLCQYKNNSALIFSQLSYNEQRTSLHIFLRYGEFSRMKNIYPILLKLPSMCHYAHENKLSCIVLFNYFSIYATLCLQLNLVCSQNFNFFYFVFQLIRGFFSDFFITHSNIC